MVEYCENCGAELGDDSKFCHECGHNIERNCPNCGERIAESENFCENCGTNLKTPQTVEKKSIFEKYKIPIIIAIIALIAIIAVFAAPSIIDFSVGTQIVDVDGYDFKIPANFNESSDSMIDDEYGGTSKHWKNGDEYIEIWILPSKYDAQYELSTVGGAKQNRYGYTGYHNVFTDGGEVFSFVKGDDKINIFVSDSNLFDKIEVL